MDVHKWRTEKQVIKKDDILNQYLKEKNVLGIVYRKYGEAIGKNRKGEKFKIYVKSSRDRYNHTVIVKKV